MEKKSIKKRIAELLPDSKSYFLCLFIATIIVTVILAGILYAAKARFSLHSTGVWWLLCIAITIVGIISFSFWEYDTNESPFLLIIPIGAICLWIAFLIYGISGSDMVKASKWYEKVNTMVTVIDDDNSGDCFPDLLGENNDTSKLPLIGIPEAIKLAETEMASIPALGSRFKLLEKQVTTQNINNDIFYVIPLEPRTMFTWNSETGSEAYFIINRNNKNVDLCQDALFTTEYAPWGDNALRIINSFLRKNNISGRATDISPEVSDNGKFNFIATIYETIGINGFKEVIGVVELDPKTKECKFYDMNNIPQYVDRVYPEEFFLEYSRIYGAYALGWSNSFMKQIGVMKPTSNLEVVYIDGVCYYYTGMKNKTMSDSSSNGIMMMNSRTGKMTYYVTNGISASRAMASAEGKTANMKYSAGYPIPLKVGGVESYFMPLRDISGNLAGYAFVAYGDFQKVGYGETVIEAQTAYMKSLSTTNTSESLANKETKTVSGDIDKIASEVVDGTTVYYVKILSPEVTDKVFVFNSTLDYNIVFAQEGNNIKITYVKTDNELIPATEVKVY